MPAPRRLSENLASLPVSRAGLEVISDKARILALRGVFHKMGLQRVLS